jgi:hypothetical protein
VTEGYFPVFQTHIKFHKDYPHFITSTLFA